MVIDTNQSQVRMLEQVRQMDPGTQALRFKAAQDDVGAMRGLNQPSAVLKCLDYRQLKLADRGAVPACAQQLSGYSRAQVTRLLSRCMGGKALVKNCRDPRPGRHFHLRIPIL